MKINKYYLTGIIFIGIAVLGIWQGRTIAQKGSKTLQLSINTEKAGYSLGEVIGLNFEISNLSGEEIEILPPNVLSGNLKLFISNDGVTFRQYQGPNWANSSSTAQSVKLPAGKNIQTEASILHNQPVAYEHLTELYAEKIRRENLDTVYAMANSGRYWLKAVYSDGKTQIESEPLAIDISEPIGLDAVIWEKIKDSGEYAYFLQTGDMRYRLGTLKELEFTESLQRIAEEFPTSNFAASINEKLIKRGEMLENLRQLNLSR